MKRVDDLCRRKPRGSFRNQPLTSLVSSIILYTYRLRLLDGGVELGSQRGEQRLGGSGRDHLQDQLQNGLLDGLLVDAQKVSGHGVDGQSLVVGNGGVLNVVGLGKLVGLGHLGQEKLLLLLHAGGDLLGCQRGVQLLDDLLLDFVLLGGGMGGLGLLQISVALLELSSEVGIVSSLVVKVDNVGQGAHGQGGGHNGGGGRHFWGGRRVLCGM